MKRNFALCLMLLLGHLIQAREKADVIIIGNPQAYRILNKYQQPLTEKESKKLLPFSPFQIITKTDTLGDGLTTAVKVQYRNAVYYLQKDENGRYITTYGQGYFKVFKRCNILMDSIKVVKDKSILLSEKYPSKGKRQYIKKGRLVTRLFRYQNFYYVAYKDVREIFGWCSLSSKYTWKPYASLSKEDFTLTPSLRNRISSKMQLINETYKHYFTGFNGITGERKSVPSWKCMIDSQKVICILSGHYRNSMQLDRSTQYIIRDLENIVLGKPFEVIYKNGEIVVQPKK